MLAQIDQPVRRRSAATKISKRGWLFFIQPGMIRPVRTTLQVIRPLGLPDGFLAIGIQSMHASLPRPPPLTDLAVPLTR